ncbi:MAG: class I SAM-dependent methyltransferase [Cocleimonas sp.]|nr:class I SAM-dependent methyltransferase [Cocleimonas sp.]
MDKHAHWQSIYSEKDATQVSWFQEHADTSLRIIQQSGNNKTARVIDVGAGASPLVDDLLNAGYHNIDVLDISAEALAIARQRLDDHHKHNQNITWHTTDILTAKLPPQHYDVWHDRAVFHFLTDEVDRKRYVEQVCHALKPGGKVIISTFGPDGPLKCSGLPIVRYDHDSLHGEFGAEFKLIEHGQEDHLTPDGSVQKFVYCYCKMESN